MRIGQGMDESRRQRRNIALALVHALLALAVLGAYVYLQTRR